MTIEFGNLSDQLSATNILMDKASFTKYLCCQGDKAAILGNFQYYRKIIALLSKQIQTETQLYSVNFKFYTNQYVKIHLAVAVYLERDWLAEHVIFSEHRCQQLSHSVQGSLLHCQLRLVSSCFGYVFWPRCN